MFGTVVKLFVPVDVFDRDTTGTFVGMQVAETEGGYHIWLCDQEQVREAVTAGAQVCV